LNLIRTSANANLGITYCSIEAIQKPVTWWSASLQRRRAAWGAPNAPRRRRRGDRM